MSFPPQDFLVDSFYSSTAATGEEALRGEAPLMALEPDDLSLLEGFEFDLSSSLLDMQPAWPLPDRPPSADPQNAPASRPQRPSTTPSGSHGTQDGSATALDTACNPSMASQQAGPSCGDGALQRQVPEQKYRAVQFRHQQQELQAWPAALHAPQYSGFAQPAPLQQQEHTADGSTARLVAAAAQRRQQQWQQPVDNQQQQNPQPAGASDTDRERMALLQRYLQLTMLRQRQLAAAAAQQQQQQQQHEADPRQPPRLSFSFDLHTAELAQQQAAAWEPAAAQPPPSQQQHPQLGAPGHLAAASAGHARPLDRPGPLVAPALAALAEARQAALGPHAAGPPHAQQAAGSNGSGRGHAASLWGAAGQPLHPAAPLVHQLSGSGSDASADGVMAAAAAGRLSMRPLKRSRPELQPPAPHAAQQPLPHVQDAAAAATAAAASAAGVAGLPTQWAAPHTAVEAAWPSPVTSSNPPSLHSAQMSLPVPAQAAASELASRPGAPAAAPSSRSGPGAGCAAAAGQASQGGGATDAADQESQAKRAKREKQKERSREQSRKSRARKQEYVKSLEAENVSLRSEAGRLQRMLYLWATQGFVTPEQALEFLNAAPKPAAPAAARPGPC